MEFHKEVYGWGSQAEMEADEERCSHRGAAIRAYPAKEKNLQHAGTPHWAHCKVASVVRETPEMISKGIIHNSSNAAVDGGKGGTRTASCNKAQSSSGKGEKHKVRDQAEKTWRLGRAKEDDGSCDVDLIAGLH